MGWTRIGQDALGDWPEAYIHDKKGFVKLRVNHNTPENYIWAKRRAGILTLGLIAGWIFVGHSIYADAEKAGKPVDSQTIKVIWVVCIISLFLPTSFMERRMRKHPKTGKSVAEYLIKKGVLYTPDREHTNLDQFVSATPQAHQKADDEEMAAAEAQFQRSNNPKKNIASVPQIYRKSSQMQVNAGFRGARIIGVIDFYNDPDGKWAGLAAAGVFYIVDYARAVERAAANPRQWNSERPEI